MENIGVKLCELASMYQTCSASGSILWQAEPETIEIIKPTIHGCANRVLYEGKATCPPAYISEVQDATVFGGSNIVLAADGKILNDELVDAPEPEYGIKPKIIYSRCGNKILLRFGQQDQKTIREGILISCDHDSNYFHWLIECLTKLLLINERNDFAGIPILVPEGIHPNLLEALGKITGNRLKIIFIKPDYAYKVERLIFPSSPTRILDRYNDSPKYDKDILLSHYWITKLIEKLKATSTRTVSPTRKIYLHRKSTRVRSLTNQDEIERVLSLMGFESIDLENVNLDYQVDLFSQVSIIVAPTGATLTNMIFSKPGTKVIALMADHPSTNYFFWPNLGHIIGANVEIICGQRMYNPNAPFSLHDDYSIDLNLLLGILP